MVGELSPSAKAVMLERYQPSSIDTRTDAEAREGDELFNQFSLSLINQGYTLATILGMAVESKQINLPTSAIIFEKVEKVFLHENEVLNSMDPVQNFRVMELIMAEIAQLSTQKSS